MKAKYFAIIAAAIAGGIFFVFVQGSGYHYSKADSVIPPGVTCQMEVGSWISEGSDGYPAVLSDLKTEKAAIDVRNADATYASGSALVKDEGRLTQNMPPGCIPDLDFYETSVNPVDKANADSDKVLYLLRAGKPLGSHLATADRDFSTAISVTQEAANRLNAYGK